MRKLLPLISTLIVLPVTTNLASNANEVHKQNDILNLMNNFTGSNGNSTINWDKIKANFDDKITNSNNFYSGPLTDAQKTFLKGQSAQQAQTFIQNKLNSNSATDTYLSQTNKDFKSYFDNRSSASSNLSIKEKILFQYFGEIKVDLALDGSNTYQDAINTLTSKIKSEYVSSDTVKITLADPNVANKTLFDDSSDQAIYNFVNNALSVNVNFQFNNEQVQTLKLQLTNISLDKDNSFDTDAMNKAIMSYFDVAHPQNLDLRLKDTRQTAFDKMVSIIKSRFPNYDQKVKLTLSNPGAANQDFFNPDIVNDVINQSAWIGVNISSATINKNLTLYFDFQLNDLEMNEVIDSIFLSQGQVNSQSLGLTTDDSYQTVVDKLNTRLFNLDKSQSYEAYLVNSDEANTTLDTQYAPDKQNIVYHVNVGFRMKVDGQSYNLGTSNLNIVNVTLGKNAQAVKAKYEQFQTLLEKFDDASTVISDFAITASFAAAAMWASAWAFGITTAPAIALSATAATLSLASATLGTIVATSEKKMTGFWGLAEAVVEINLLAKAMCWGLYSVVSGAVAELNATSWGGWMFSFTVIAALWGIYKTIQLAEKGFA